MGQGDLKNPITGGQEGRRVAGYLTGPVAAGVNQKTYAVAANYGVRNSDSYIGALLNIPAPRDNIGDDFGIQQGGGFTAQIARLQNSAWLDGHWDGYSLISKYGESPTAFTRNLPVPIPDWEGITRWTITDEFAPAAGCRRVQNLLSNTDTLATQSVTVAAGTHILVLGKCTGSITLTGTGSGTLAGSATSRRQLVFTATAGTLTVTVTGAVLAAMVVPMQFASVLIAPEYVANLTASVWPHQGFGVRGVKWFRAPNLNTVDGSSNITEASPTLVRQAWVYLPGGNGNILSTPNSAANTVTGDIDIRFLMSMPDWQQGGSPVITGKWFGGYLLHFNGAGLLGFAFSQDGSTLAGGVVYTATVNISTVCVPGQKKRGRFTRIASTGQIKFYTSDDNINWVQLGATLTSVTGAMFAFNAPLYIGYNAATAAQYLAANVLELQILNGINGPVVVNFNAANFNLGATTATMSTGEVFTITQSGTGNVAAVREAFTDAAQRPSRHDPAETQLITTDISAWNQGGTDTPTAALGPDGLMSAWTLTDNDAAVVEYSFAGFTIANDSLRRAYSVLIKKDLTTARLVGTRIICAGGTNQLAMADLNTATGVATAVSGNSGTATFSVADAGDWWRLTISVANNSSGNTTCYVELYPANGTVAGSQNVAAVGSATFAFPTLVVGALVSSLMPYNAGTRNEAALTFPASIINDAEGFVYLSAKLDSLPATGIHLVAGGSAGVQPLISNTPAAAIYDSTTATFGTSGTTLNKTSYIATWSGATTAIFVNGAQENTGLYDGSFGAGSYTIGSNAAAVGYAPSGSIGPIKWGKKRAPAKVLAALNNLAETLESSAVFYALASTVVGQQFDLDLVSEMTNPDGTILSITDSRRAVGKKVKISKNVLEVTFADIDLDKLTAVYPTKTYTVADFTRLYIDHVGRPVPDLGPGTLIKVPMSFIADSSGAGPFKFAVCEARSGATYTINTIYRAGQIVNASEYTTGTTTGALTGVIVQHVSFVREQRDTGNKLYEMEAAVTVTGNREPSNELARILALYGVATDASFATAAAVDNAAGIFCDAAYVRPRTGKAIVEDLLRMARADLIKSAGGAWGLVQDKIRSSVATYQEASGLIDNITYEQPELPVEIAVNYRAAKSGEDTGWLFPAQRRALGGAGRAVTLDMPYCYDGNVADRLADYYGKRAKLWRAQFDVYAAQWDCGDMLTINGITCWQGNKSFIPRGITRGIDGNTIDSIEYDATIYAYTAGTIPSGAGNVYAADYSQTPPVAPTSLSIQISSTSSFGAFVTLRVVPPTANWAKLTCQAQNNSNSEIVQADFQLNGANWEVTMSGLKPGTNYTFRVWAVNANNVQGATVSTTATSYGPVQYISDTHILSGGVGSVSVQNSSLGSGKLNYTVVSSTFTLGSGATAGLANAGGANTLQPIITADTYPGDIYQCCIITGGGSNTHGLVNKNANSDTVHTLAIYLNV